MIKDAFGRVHDYLRISLTDNCNLRCFYCMPEEDYDFAPASRLMQAHEIQEIASIFVRHGVKKIRLTGGEPLVRKDAVSILEGLAALPVTLTLTTNGTRLDTCREAIRKGGIRSINISLDTLDPQKFRYVTRRDLFSAVMRNIQYMLDDGLRVKINVVVMKGLNDHEINRFVAWTKEVPVHVRLIEFMPFSGNRWTSNQVMTWKEMLEEIGKEFDFIKLADGEHDTAKAYQVPGHAGTFAVISTMSAPFCSSCNRMRLTADGKLKNCLFSKGETDLLTALRKGEPVEPLIRATMWAKAEALGGQFSKEFDQLNARDIDNRSMITIGG